MFWGVNLGLLVFVIGLILDSAEIKRIGAPVMGIALLFSLGDPRLERHCASRSTRPRQSWTRRSALRGGREAARRAQIEGRRRRGRSPARRLGDRLGARSPRGLATGLPILLRSGGVLCGEVARSVPVCTTFRRNRSVGVPAFRRPAYLPGPPHRVRVVWPANLLAEASRR